MPMFIWFVVYAVVMIALMAAAYLLTPSPKTPKENTPKLEVPVNQEGKLIGLLYGTELIKDINVVGYWRLRIVTVEKPGPGKKQ